MNINPVQYNVVYNTIKSFPSQNSKYRRMLFEEEIDSFVSNVIKNERENTGKIYNYKTKLDSKELNRVKDDLTDSLEVFILNDNIHIIKQNSLTNKLFDVVKKIVYSD